MPSQLNAVSVRPRSASPASNTGASQLVRRPWLSGAKPSSGPSGGPGSDRTMPRKIDGIASSQSGTVMTGGDSWMWSQIAFGPRKSPQNVSPMSRNM